MIPHTKCPSSECGGALFWVKHYGAVCQDRLFTLWRAKKTLIELEKFAEQLSRQAKEERDFWSEQ